MFNSFDEYIDSNSSEKIVLIHIHSVKRLYGFVSDTGHYSKTTPYFVTGVKQGVTGTSLTSVVSKALVTDATKFYYDIQLSKLYLYSYDNLVDEVIVTYRFFYSNAPINLSWDLGDTSYQVEYQPRLESSPVFKSTMAQGKKGISLIGSGTISLNNSDGGLDNTYDNLIWDNKDVSVYSYNRDLPASEAKPIFIGIVTGKTFSPSMISFSVKDSIYALDSKIPLVQYGSLTRTEDSLKYKRQVYGKVDNLLCQSIDQVGDGYALTGTLSGTVFTSSILGVGTAFLSEVSPSDELIIDSYKVSVEEVLSDTQLRVSELEASFSAISASIKPDIHFRNKNRLLQVAGHAVKKWSTTISSITSRNRIIVADATSFYAGDIIAIDTESKTIRRVSGNTIILQTNYNLSHTVGSTVTKTEINSIRYGEKQREISPSNVTIINNNTDGAQIQLSSSAEYDATKELTLNNLFRFVNGRSKVWLGSPTFIDILCVGQTATGSPPFQTTTGYSLMGTYFSVKDEDGRETAFWFKDNLPEEVSSIKIPSAAATIAATDGNKQVSIPLESRAYTAAEMVVLIGGIITNKVSAWTYSVSSNTCKLDSKDTVDIAVGTAGTSGFTVTKTLSGANAAAHVNLLKYINVRDFIKTVDQSSTSYVEILSVDERSLTLRLPYTGTSQLNKMNYKNVEYIQDDTPVYVNCYGKTKDGLSSGDFIKTAPEVVFDLLTQSGLGSRIDTASFDIAVERSPYTVSLSLPLSKVDASAPVVKDIINIINQSTLGSLHITNGLDLGYDILDAHTDETLREITDSDIISWTVSDDAFDLSSSTISNYRFSDYDPNTNASSNKQITFTSDFVNNYVGSTVTKENNTYMYEESDVEEITQRDQFINSLSTSTIKVKGSITLSKYTIGERVLLNFNGLYRSYGSNDSVLRIGIISSINNTGEKVDLEIMDLGSLYNRAARIVDDTGADYATSTDTQKTVQSYITEDNSIVNDDEDTAGTNLIG